MAFPGQSHETVIAAGATSPGSVWAFTNRFEGVSRFTTWSKVAQGEFGYGAGQQIAADGRGGLWLPMPGPLGGPSHLVHYAAGKLTAASLPVGARYIYVDSIARIPGTTQQLAGGFTHAKGNLGRNIAAVILQYR